MRKIKITAELTPAEEGGYVVYSPELDITTEGETVEEAVDMLKDAASGYVEDSSLQAIPGAPGPSHGGYRRPGLRQNAPPAGSQGLSGSGHHGDSAPRGRVR